MIDRRALILATVGAAFSRPADAAPKLADDGMYHFDWYLESFLDLAEDVETARANGKRLAIVWGQRACIFCQRMAQEHLSDPKISGYVQANFEVLHLNLFGAREVTDFDGAKLSERASAQRYGIRATPTILFFPEGSDGLSARPPLQREIARMPGLLEPGRFLSMFRFVREKGYEKSSFQGWLKTNA